VNILDEVSQNFVDAAYDTNCNRSFPLVADGLKPGQRACLWEMYKKGYTPDKPHVKSAKISGAVCADIWPHSSDAIYETFVRMSQSWINNNPEVEFHGANGNCQLGADSFAAPRYTEARLAPVCYEGMFTGINKQNVPMQPNFSEDEMWPVSLPAVFPRLLVNGAKGIGYSIACFWLPRNFNEVADAICDYIKHGTVDDETCLPDFPSGGTIVNPKEELVEINRTGKGKVVLEAKYEIAGQEIRFTEFCYQTYIEPIIGQIDSATDSGKLQGVKSRSNRSDKDRILLVVECKKGFEPKEVLEQLFQHTDLRCQYNANQMGIISKTPVLLNLRQTIEVYTKHNLECVTREHEYDLKRAQERIEVLEGLKRAVEDIDTVVKVLKEAQSAQTARESLAQLGFSEAQVKAIMDMRLSRLVHLEAMAIDRELDEKRAVVAECEKVLGSEKAKKNVLGKRLRALAKKYGNDRRTKIEERVPEKVVQKETTEDSELIFADGCYLKRVKPGSGGEFLPGDGMVTLFSSLGLAYRITASSVPRCSVKEKGTAVGKLLTLDDGENILAATPWGENTEVVSESSDGYRKALKHDYFTGNQQAKKGSVFMGLNEGQTVTCVEVLPKDEYEASYAERYPKMGKAARGVRG
jgi:DNA gyrase/topoisomerase IV subunit A